MLAASSPTAPRSDRRLPDPEVDAASRRRGGASVALCQRHRHLRLAQSVTANNAATVDFILGNGNNAVSALAATSLTISAGNGSNTITIGATGAMSIVLGSHTGVDAITLGANASSSAISSITELCRRGCGQNLGLLWR